MKASILIALAATAFLFASADAAAQMNFELGLHAAYVDPSGENEFTDEQSSFELDNGTGFGASAGWTLPGPFSLQLAAYRLEADATLESDFPPAQNFELGSLKLTTITATGRYHFLPDSTLSAFIGGGAAWVQPDDLDDGDDLGALDFESIELEDEVTWVAEAGVRFRITDRVTVEAGAKYIPSTVDSQAHFTDGSEPSDPVEIDINPLVISGGVMLRF